MQRVKYASSTDKHTFQCSLSCSCTSRACTVAAVVVARMEGCIGHTTGRAQQQGQKKEPVKRVPRRRRASAVGEAAVARGGLGRGGLGHTTGRVTTAGSKKGASQAHTAAVARQCGGGGRSAVHKVLRDVEQRGLHSGVQLAQRVHLAGEREGGGGGVKRKDLRLASISPLRLASIPPLRLVSTPAP